MNLSVCIPTYNRQPFLHWTLNRLLRDFDRETDIVVCDNASTDGTRTLVTDGPLAWPGPGEEGEIRYMRQSSNIGAFPNMRAALLLAERDYAVYCGDDDYLIPERVDEAIAYLDAHPEVIAYFAPCMTYNEIEGKPIGPAFRLEAGKTFNRARPMELFNFLVVQHIWPEHAIFRTEAMREALKPRTRAYWAFTDIPYLLAAGDLYFSPEPFYRNIFQHPVGFRQQLGNEQCLTDFEEYRAGLEIMAHDLFVMSGYGEFPVEESRRANLMIGYFLYRRYEAAYRIHKTLGREAEAARMLKRMKICNPFEGPIAATQIQ
jgi:glycosyltransferase involved in cell wall biosynthesis